MKTQEITVTIKATVPVGESCNPDMKSCDYCHIGIAWINAHCSLFRAENLGCHIVETEEMVIVQKCQQCLDACDNGTDRALKELAGEGE